MGKYNIIIENDLCDEVSEKHFSVDNWLELMGNLCEILKNGDGNNISDLDKKYFIESLELPLETNKKIKLSEIKGTEEESYLNNGILSNILELSRFTNVTGYSALSTASSVRTNKVIIKKRGRFYKW
jgi:hypothetical protein